MSNSISKNRYKSNKSHKDQGVLPTNRKICEYAMNLATGIFIMALFIALPLGFKDHYYSIGDFKFELFSEISSTYVIFMTVLMIPYIYLCIKMRQDNEKGDNRWSGNRQSDNKQNNNRQNDNALDSAAENSVMNNSAMDKVKSVLSRLNIVDKFVISYAIVCIISFFCSDFHSFTFFTSEVALNGAWYGFMDWFMGLRSQLLFVLCYFYVSRFFSEKIIHNVFVWVAIPATLAFIVAILHRLYIDPLGFYVNLNVEQKLQFLSTIGQSSWYSSYLSTIFPFMIAYYFACNEAKKKPLMLFTLIIGFMSLTSQNTDSAYLSLFAVLITLFMFAFENNSAMKNYLEIIITFLLSARFMGLLMNIFTPDELKLDTLSLFILHNNLLWIPIIIVIVLYALLVYSEKKQAPNMVFDVCKIAFVRWIVLSLCVVFVIGAVLAVVIINKNNIYVPENTPFYNYLVFDRLWGNGRGGTWMLSADIFRSFTPISRLFGCGNDCYGYYAYKYLSTQATELWHELYIANAHNEWFNSLICTGYFGLVTYLGIFISAFVMFIRNRGKHVIVCAAALCVISYVFHGIFCYQTCMNTPLIFAIMALGVWGMRKE